MTIWNPIPRDILMGWIVLAVDDDPMSLDVLRRMLKHYGATVQTATNGEEGLAAARLVKPRLIVSDLSMPVMDGWEMIRRLKSDTNLASVPIIALTAHAMPGDRERAISVGCHNYLTKPLTPATFIQDLLKLLMDIPDLNIALSGRS